MISYIKGALGAVEDDVIVVETGGIGLAVHVPLSLLEELPPLGEEVTVYTYFQVREDAMTLYGFLHRQDREMFKQLLGVNGIGPKGALGILSVMRPDDLRIAIVSGDAKAISRAPGIGAKTAQRLILDLKDKVDLEEVMMASFGGGKEAASDTGTGASVAGMAASAKGRGIAPTAPPAAVDAVMTLCAIARLRFSLKDAMSFSAAFMPSGRTALVVSMSSMIPSGGAKAVSLSV